MSSDEREQILRSLQPLFETARRDGTWFYCNYQDMWFSPAELAEYHRQGRFVWGPVNWTLRPPSVLLEQAQQSVKSAQKRLEDVQARIRKEAARY